jgi:hypothetical protein
MPRGGTRPGAGRPKIGDPVEVRFNPDTLAEIDQYAAAYGLTRASMVRDMAEDYLRGRQWQRDLARLRKEGWTDLRVRAVAEHWVRLGALDDAAGSGMSITTIAEQVWDALRKRDRCMVCSDPLGDVEPIDGEYGPQHPTCPAPARSATA